MGQNIDNQNRVSSVESDLSGTISDILENKGNKMVQVETDCLVTEAARTMSQEKVGSVLVLEEQKLVGIFTERDLMHKVVAAGFDPNMVKVGEVMTSRIATIPPETPLREAAQLLSQNRIRHLPILQDGQLVGVVSVGDIFAWKLREQEVTMRKLEEYFFN